MFDCHGLTLRDNVIRDRGETGEEGIRVSLGVAGLMLAAGDADGDDRRSLLVDVPAAVVTGNRVHVTGGPAVVLVGVGPMQVHGNHLVSHYLARRSLVPFGRGLLVLDLGGAPDTGLAGGGKVFANLGLHGPVQVHDNQVVVQDRGAGLAPPDADLDPYQATLAQLLPGSAVAVITADDASVQANHVVNEVAPGDRPTIRSSVWTAGMTIRLSGNRISEAVGSALLSYAGVGLLAHTVTGNTTTHCLRVEGSGTAVSDNIELHCRTSTFPHISVIRV